MAEKGQSNLYICTAVIVSDEHKQDVIKGLAEIVQKHRLGTVLKSSQVGANVSRRIEILKDLMSLDFTYLFLMTDKNKFSPDSPLGKYKKSRYKFLHRKLNQIIAEKSCNLNIVIDQYGSQEFQDECLEYFQKDSCDFFAGEISTSYADDQVESLLQIADFIGGSLMYCFDKTRKGEHSDKIRKILQPKEVGCEFFPRGIYPTLAVRPIPSTEIEEQIYRHLYNKAASFLDKTEDSTNPEEQMQFQTLNRLFIARNYEEPADQWIFSEDLRRDLTEQNFEISKRAFTVKIIGGLRYKGIIIAGSPSGYKLALNLDDITNYLAHDSNIVFPMLSKLKLARDEIMSLAGYNILAGEYQNFDAILTQLSAEQIRQYVEEPDVEKMEMIKDDEE